MVDDDPLNTMICSVILKDALGEVDFRAFTDPRDETWPISGPR